MAQIDERVVAMSFETAKFDAGVQKTLGGLKTLSDSLNNISKLQGLDQLEKSSSKVTLNGPMSALDKLKSKLGMTTAGTTFSDMEKDADTKVTMSGPVSALDKLKSKLGMTTSGSTFSDMEQSASKVTLNGPQSALDKLKAKFGSTNAGTTFSDMERASSNVQFAQPARALDNLQSKLGQTNAGTTFTDMENAANRVSFGGLTQAIQNVGSQFTVLKGTAAVALGNIASQAASKGAAFAKSFTFAPIKQGFEEYQTNLGSIQTILSNTRDSGGNLKTVNSSLDELNTYSDKTIYNFSEMAKNIGTFTAAGVQLKPATSAIKGIANLAAMSGSSSQQASTAMYQLSQAISSGKVGLQDWNSVVNAGMGGAVFQKSLMRTAENMGALQKGAVKIDKATGKATVNGSSFRESIMAKPGQQSWLTSDVLTNTLSQLTGDMSDAELAAKGYSAEQIKAIQGQAKAAQDAATQVKTLPQVFDVAKETIGSGWSATFRTIFGDFSESKKTFTDLSQTINGFINTNADARNKVLDAWKALGGRTVLIDGIKQAFSNLMDILGTIKDAFREVFPAQTGKDLFEMTKGFSDLMDRLKPNEEMLGNLKRIFAGFFAVVHIGWTFIQEFVGAIGNLLGVVGKGSGGFLGFIASIGDFLVSIDRAIAKGKTFEAFFNLLGGIIKAPLSLLGKLGDAIGSMFEPSGRGKTAAQHAEELERFGKSLSPIERFVNNIKDAWGQLTEAFAKTKTALEPFWSSFVGKLSEVGDIIKNAFSGLNYDDLMSGLQAGLLAGILVAVKKALGFDSIVSFGKPFEGINKLLGGFTGQMEAMQSKLHAEALLAIAGAIAVLAAGLLVLSKIPADDLARALTASAVGLGELMGAMKLMTAGMGKMGILQLPVIAAGMIGLAFAVVILAGAMKIFATMSWENIAKGFAGVAGSLGAVAGGLKLMGNPASLVAKAAGLILIGVSLNIIAGAMKIFATMSWEDMIKGLFAIAESLGMIALGISMMPPTLPLTAAGLVLVAIALNGIAIAVATFANIDILSLITGLGGMGAALVTIGLAIGLIPPTVALQAVGLLILAAALTTMAGAIAIMGSLGIGTVVKGLITIGAALIVLAGGLTLMSGTLAGAAALLAASTALALLAPTLGYLGTLSTGTIIKGLIAIAASIVVVGLASTVAAPGLIELGIALIPLGIGLAVVAGAVYIFAKAMQLLGSAGPKAVSVVIASFTAFIAALPSIVINFVKGLLSIIDQLTVLLPKVIVALGVIIDTIIQFVIAKAPSLAIAIGVLVDSFLTVIVSNAPKILAAGFKLLLTFLSGISGNIGRITTQAVNIIVNFFNALTANAPRLVGAGVTTMMAFLQGFRNRIPSLVAMVGSLIQTFITAVGQQASRIVSAAGSLMVRLITAIGSYVGRMVTAGTNMIVNFIRGIGNAGPRIVSAAVTAASRFMNALANGLVRMVDTGFHAIIRFLNGIANAIRENDDQLIDAGANILDAIVDGMIKAAGRMAGPIKKAIDGLFGLLPGWAKKVLGIHSPSSVFMDIGMQTMSGMAVGISAGGSNAVSSMETSAKDIVDTAKGTLGQVPDILSGIMDVEPTIAPVLDLSGVHKEAQNMPDLSSNIVPITAAASYGQAMSISQEQQAATDTSETSPAGPGNVVHFEQNNYSPEALSPLEIYRQTNNQLSIAKSQLGITNPNQLGVVKP